MHGVSLLVKKNKNKTKQMDHVDATGPLSQNTVKV